MAKTLRFPATIRLADGSVLPLEEGYVYNFHAEPGVGVHLIDAEWLGDDWDDEDVTDEEQS